MNHKGVKYGLIAGVVLIWGIIIFRIINGLNQKDDLPVGTKRINTTIYNADKDSFVLFANYPDPFIPASEKDTIELIDNPPLLQKKQINNEVGYNAKTTPQTDIGSIQYLGMIANPEEKKKIAILTIAGKEYLVKEKDKVEAIVIRKITLENIVIFVNGITETIERKIN